MLSAEKAYERRWWTLGVLCMSLIVIVIDNSILNVALPTIVRDLGASGSDLQWILDSYIIVFASLLLIAGALGDKYGRKGALTVGLILFGVLGPGCVRHVARDAHRVTRAHGHRCRVHLPDDAVDPHQHVRGQGAGQGDRRVGRRVRPRRRDRPAHRRPPGRALRLGCGLLREHPDLRRGPDPRVLLHPHVARSRQPAARPDRRAAVDPHARLPALRDHPGGRQVGHHHRHRRAVRARADLPGRLRVVGDPHRRTDDRPAGVPQRGSRPPRRCSRSPRSRSTARSTCSPSTSSSCSATRRSRPGSSPCPSLSA